MSQAHQGGEAMTRRQIVKNWPLGLSILALIFAFGAFWFEFNRDVTTQIVLDIEGDQIELTEENSYAIPLDDALQEQLADMDRVTQDAQSAARSADFVLGFLEGGSILLAALVGVAVVVFGSSIQDVRSQLDASVSEADKRLSTTEKRMEDLVETMQQRVSASLIEGEARFQANEERNEQRVGELTARIEDSIKDTEATIQNLHGIVNEAVNSAKEDAEKSFRVLSLLLLAEQQVRARNRKTAISTLEEAYGLDPSHQTTNYLLGYLYVGRKDFNLAIDHLERALQFDPTFAPALAAMGLAQRRMGDAEMDDMRRRQMWAQAELNLSKALEADPTLIDADNESYFGTLGGLYRRQGRNEEALRAYEDAVKITPNNSYPVANLAVLYKKLDHEEEAQRMYERAIEISEAILDDHPGDTWARLDLALAFLVTGQSKKAFEQYRNVIGRVAETSPLEAGLSVLKFLSDAHTPIEGLGQAMQMLQDAIDNLIENPDKFAETSFAASD
jgi:tetratricopeptide (TPR) repeat protein